MTCELGHCRGGWGSSFAISVASCAAHFHITFLEHHSRSLHWPSFQVGQIPGVRSPLGQRNKWASSSICFFWVLETQDSSIVKTAVLSLGHKHKRCFHRLLTFKRSVVSFFTVYFSSWQTVFLILGQHSRHKLRCNLMHVLWEDP